MEKTKRIQSPIVLYVEDADFYPRSMMNEGQRITILDLELKEPEVRKLLKELQERIEKEKPFAGVRIRFSGTLTLS